MKALVAYYSRTGHTAQVAEAFQRALDAKGVSVEVLRLHRRQEAGFLACGFEARRGAKPAMVELPMDVSGYDMILLGFPTWAGRASSPANSMVAGIQNVDGKQCILFSVSAGKDGFIKGLNDIEAYLKGAGVDVIGKQGFFERDLDTAGSRVAEFEARVLGHSGS